MRTVRSGVYTTDTGQDDLEQYTQSKRSWLGQIFIKSMAVQEMKFLFPDLRCCLESQFMVEYGKIKGAIK
jgi:hypothetical protein